MTSRPANETSHLSLLPRGDRRRRAIRMAPAALLVLLQPVALWAATITVTGFDSTVADDGVCTLREAVTAANTDTASGATPGECAAGLFSDTVVLTGDVTLTVVDNTPGGNGPNGLPRVSSDVTVDGAGFTVERDSGAPLFRFFYVDIGASLTLDSITLTGGRVTGQNVGTGGAVRTFGTLVINDSTLTGNQAHAGGAVSTSAHGSLATITNSTISNNTAEAGGRTGAVYNTNGVGAGSIGADVVMINSTVSGNTSGAGWGAVTNRWPTLGDSISLTNTTIASNTGLGVAEGTGSGGITLTGSLLADNSSNNCSSGNVDGGGNFSDDISCPAGFGSISAVDDVDVDFDLLDNGGPTLTHALPPGSAAINGAGACGLSADQRGFPRPLTACDSGAFEAAIVVTTDLDNLTPMDGLCTLREAVQNANANTDTTMGDCEEGHGDDAIVIPAITVTLTIAGASDNGNLTGDLDVTDPLGLRIIGAGARATIVQAGTTCHAGIDRIFEVLPGAGLRLEDLTVQNGNSGGGWGGGILVSGAGASTEALAIERCRITCNHSDSFAGGIGRTGADAGTAPMTIDHSLIDGNDSGGSFGALGNSRSGTFIVTNSTISGNTATQTAAVGRASGGPGALLTHTTVTGNVAITGLGGVSSSTISNSILAGNEGPPGSGSNCVAVTSLGYNIVQGACPSGGTGDQILAGALSTVIGALADNGGPTDTHAVVLGGQAYDQIPGAANGCGTTITDDQRGTVRPQGTCDVGAFELINNCEDSVSEYGDYSLVYELNIPDDSNFQDGTPAYAVDNSGSIGVFDRVAYCLELDDGSGLEWAWTSMDDFTGGTVTHTGVPVISTGATFETGVAGLSDMNVFSNVAGVVTGSGITTGSLEFFHHSALTTADSGLPGANSATFDYDDTKNVARAFGQMQVHNYVAQQTIFGYNGWDAPFSIDDVGIGNNPGTHPDWSGESNASTYTVRRNLRVFVREGVPTADLTLTKSESADPVTAGSGASNLTYTVTVTNGGPSPATGLTLSEALTLPSGVSIVSITPSGGSVSTYLPANDPNGTWEIGDLAVSASATLTVVLTVGPSAAPGTDVVSDTVTVTVLNEANNGDTSVTEATSVTAEADLSITKTDSPDPVSALETLTYTITVSNAAGPSDATGVVVTDTLPAGVSSPVTTGCAEDPNGVPACTLGTIAAGGMDSYTIDVTVDVSAPGSLTNTATVSSDVTDPASGNDTAMATTTVLCPDPATPGLYGGFTAADCANSVVKAKNQAQLDAYLADFGVGGGTKPKHVNVLFNPVTANFTVISPCRIKVLGASKLIAVAADNVCLFGRAGVTLGAGTPVAGSLIDTGDGDVTMVSEEGKVQTKPGIGYIAGDVAIEASTTAEIGSNSTLTVSGALAITSDGISSTSHALIEPGSLVMVDSLTMTAPEQVRIRDNADVDVIGDLTMTSSSDAAEIQAGAMVAVGGALQMSGLSCQIGGSATVAVTGTATLAASGSPAASDADILSGATLTAAEVSQTAEHKALLSGGATIDAGAGNVEIDAPACVVAGTVIAGTTSGACLP